MLPVLFLLLLTIHGLVHLIGFLNEWKLAPVQFSGKTFFPASGLVAKIAGTGWLLTTMLFLTAATLFFFKRDDWWMAAGLGVMFSQALIILYWRDARLGTIVNLLVLAVTLPAYGSWKFEQKCRQEISAFLSPAVPAAQVLLPQQIDSLPLVVQRWLRRSGVVGQPIAQMVSLRQKGELRTRPDGTWMPFEAQQLFTTASPGFYWKVKVDGNPFMRMTGRDQYLDGRGQMFIQWQSLIPVANASGPETDQGSLLRYLAEMMWFPAAATQNYIHWESVDSLHARATMHWGGIMAGGIYQFSADGDVVGFEAERYYSNSQGNPSLERWQIHTTDFRDFNGIRIPYQGEVTWKLKTGDFTWFKYEIEDLQYNQPIFPN